MADWTVSDLVEDFKAGRISRRRFVSLLLGAGVSLPLIGTILAACSSSNNNKSNTAATRASGTQPAAATAAGGSAAAGTAAAGTPAASAAKPTAAAGAAFTPTKRGGGGTLKLLWWQGPILLNGHLSGGTKEADATRPFYEPLAGIDQEGNIVPILAAEAPSYDKGTLDKGGTFVTWKLKQGVTWHDGQPFNADDVVFTADWIMDPETAAFSAQRFANVAKVEKVDDYTVKITFKQPTLAWSDPFVGNNGWILPKHIYSQYKGKTARDAPANLKPVGTGPYKIVSFTPGDLVVGEINDKYHVENRPFFDRIELKGGGDAPGAARAVLETGEYDFAWNLQVEATVLKNLEKGGQGSIITFNGGAIEHVLINMTDPNIEVDGEKSSLKAPHPFLTDLKVRQALALAIDRKTMVEQLYLPSEQAGVFFDYTPKKYVPDGKWQQDLNKANQLLDDAGWKKGGDGIRSKDGKRMKVLYQTSVNNVRQNEQVIAKDNLQKLGIEVELKSVDATVFFGSDPANPDTYPHFYADLEMFTTTRSGPDDYLVFFSQYITEEICQKANNWSKQNRSRYSNPKFDALYQQAKKELDPVKAADLAKQMNQMLNDDVALIPLVARDNVRAAKKNLKLPAFTGWDSDLWQLAYWSRA